MQSLNPTQAPKFIPARPKDAPSRVCVIGGYSIVLGDVAGTAVDKEDLEFVVVYKKLEKYEPMQQRGKYVVPIEFQDIETMEIELDRFNKAMADFKDYYGDD